MSDNSKPNWQSFVNTPPSDKAASGISASSTTYMSAHIDTDPNSVDSLNSGLTSTSSSVTNSSGSPKNVCVNCQKPISGHFVRALDNVYHSNCFICHDCNSPCPTKYFPYEIENEQTIPLCEHCYFKRQDLLCYKCDSALRGSYITALGKKYHVDHFTCSLCSVVFGSDDSYYEHESNIYCRYHYSTLYAAKCEGCSTAILKQFVEIFRGGREQQWHPECYMINKFWNVMISPETSDEDVDSRNITNVRLHIEPTNEEREELLAVEQNVEEKAFKIWSILCGYEEATAALISDMLQYASSNRYNDALLATSKLVFKIEILLAALDVLVAKIDPLIAAMIEYDKLSEEEQENESDEYRNLMNLIRSYGLTQLHKEPKTLCKKIVSFMLILSKSRSNVKQGPSQELLDTVTSMAHYLKLLIRYGLSNSLRYDRLPASDNIVDKVLERVSVHEMIPENPLENLGVSGKANDRCVQCNTSMEDRCAALGEKRWHIDCLQCSRCGDMLGSRFSDAVYHIKQKTILCRNCVTPDDDIRDDLQEVSKLMQFIYLVKIALARLKLVLDTYDSRDKQNGTDQVYMSTLVDIRKNRSTRLSKQLSEARRSRGPKRESAEVTKELMVEKKHDNDKTGTFEKSIASTAVNNFSNSTVETKNSSNANHERPLLSETMSSDKRLPKVPVANKPSSPSQFQEKKPEASVEKRREKPGFIKRISSQKRPKKNKYGHTTDLIKNEKSSLILDDIQRIVAAEKQSQTKKEVFMSDLSPIEMFYVRHIAVFLIKKLIPEWGDELVDLIETRKQPSTIWEKFGKAFNIGGGGGNNAGAGSNGDKKKGGNVGVFGVSLETQVEKYGVDSTFGLGIRPLRIPAFVDECITSMRQMDMSVEGIFRKNGNIRKAKELADKVDKKPDQTGLLVDESPIQLAALLKRYLRELPDSLLTIKLQKYWLRSQTLFTDSPSLQIEHASLTQSQQTQMKIDIMRYLDCLVPTAHRDVMEVLFNFLNWVATFSGLDEDEGQTGSKMDIKNLATVIAPNVIFGKGGESEEFFVGIIVVEALIRESALFARVPERILDIMNQVITISSPSSPTTAGGSANLTAVGSSGLNDSARTAESTEEIMSKIEIAIKEFVPPNLELPEAAALKKTS